MNPSQKDKSKQVTEQNQQRVQNALAPFEDSLLLQLPSAEQIIADALKRKNQKRHRYYIWACSGLTGLLALLLFNPSYQQQVYRTELGEQKNFDLGDGTQLRLNTNTQLELREHLLSREVVLLQGEAAFALQQQPWQKWMPWFKRSFIVYADDARIEDIGTIFQVRIYDNRDLQIAVTEGQVRVYQQQQQLDIYQGQSLYRKQQVWSQPKQLDLQQLTSWQMGYYYFNNQPLIQVIDELNRYGDLSVKIVDPNVAKLRVSGQVNLSQRQQFVQDLPKFSPVRVTKTPEQYYLVGPMKDTAEKK